MKTNVSLNISVDQSNALACLIHGEIVQRLATREEKADLECGVSAETVAAPAMPAVGQLSARNAKEEATIAKLRAEGKSDGYIVGGLKVGRGSPFTRRAAYEPAEIIVDSEVPSP